jgi:hypothetical protein
MWQHMFSVPVMRTVWRCARPAHLRITGILNIRKNYTLRIFYAPRFFSGQNRKKSAQITRANTVIRVVLITAPKCQEYLRVTSKKKVV